MSLAGTILDIYDDANYSILRMGGEKIASCSFESSEKLSRLPDSAFSLIIKTASGDLLRKYPRHNADSIKISAFYLNKVKDTLPENIKVAAIDGLVNKKTNYVDMSKEEVKLAETVNFGLKINGKSYFPLDTEEQVKVAVATFKLSCDKLIPSERYELAQNIIKVASKHNVTLNNDIHKYSHTELNKLAWLQAVKARQVECLDSDKIAALKAYKPESAKGALAFLAEFDKNAGLTNKVPDIYTSVFSDVMKIAGLKVASKSDKIKSIPNDLIKEAYDSSFAEEWAKDPMAVYTSLPMPVREEIDARFLK
jgi:hypothetical protein